MYLVNNAHGEMGANLMKPASVFLGMIRVLLLDRNLEIA